MAILDMKIRQENNNIDFETYTVIQHTHYAKPMANKQCDKFNLRGSKTHYLLIRFIICWRFIDKIVSLAGYDQVFGLAVEHPPLTREARVRFLGRMTPKTLKIELTAVVRDAPHKQWRVQDFEATGNTLAVATPPSFTEDVLDDKSLLNELSNPVDRTPNTRLVVTIPSDLKVSSPERSVLSKGLNFVPLNPLPDEFSIRRDVSSSFCRRLRLRFHFGDSDETDNTSSEDVFRSFQSKRSPWTPKPGKSKVLDSVIKSINSDLERLLPPKDTPHFLRLIQNFEFPENPSERTLFTMDVTGLYTSIPHNAAIAAIRHYLDLRQDPNIPTTTFLRLTELDLTQNCFQFNVVFLDAELSISDRKIKSNLHFKPTDSHNYLMYPSNHPRSCTNSIPFSQLLRARRICSDDQDFAKVSKQIISFFEQRQYPQRVLSNALKCIQEIDRASALAPKTDHTPTRRISLVLSFHPSVTPIVRAIYRNVETLRHDPSTRDHFPEPPITAFRIEKNISKHLVRASQPQAVVPNTPGTFPCNRGRCDTCPVVSYDKKLSIVGPNNSRFNVDQLLPVLQPMSFTFSYVNAVIYCKWEKQNVVLLTELLSTCGQSNRTSQGSP
ncbi:hypothetical protein HOLleu_02449 [Holothuria leucospilota]|uniref:Helix-turn-helix domain-containing protein n=1 Tax=Holothuria leucospilota TaxID=206669 RepID=A0A9Q1CPM5_HOLLE|nr:hypothetical protein HOLleu_02449 [Holothuria leucospilota]